MKKSENGKEYQYDGAGRLSIAGNPYGKYVYYDYDRRGNRVKETRMGEGTYSETNYEYNRNNELVKEEKITGVDPVSTTWYTYDARGNVLSSTVDEYSNAEAGAAEGITGAVLGESETSGAEVYEYDVFGKMEQIQKGNQTIRYGYNADGQRIEKTVNSQSTEYIWDGDNIVSEKTGESAAAYYQRGLGLIASAQGDEYYRDFYFKNAHGDVTGVYYAGNNSQKAGYEYDPFGKQIDPNAAGEELLSGSYEGDPNDSNPYRYASEYFDRETGNYYTAGSYYSPSNGRLLSPDPVILLPNHNIATQPIATAETDTAVSVIQQAKNIQRNAYQSYLNLLRNQSKSTPKKKIYGLPYNPDEWNTPGVMESTNCYKYALNMTGSIWPGDVSGKRFYLYFMEDPTITQSEAIVIAVKKDAEVYGLDIYEYNESIAVPKGGYLIAIVLESDDPEYSGDFHFYRQNDDGTWSHKPGSTAVTNLDASGNVITDPMTADRNYKNGPNYEVFVGYYVVVPKDQNS